MFLLSNTDITRVRFSDRARWGKQEKFKVFEEELLETSLVCCEPLEYVLNFIKEGENREIHFYDNKSLHEIEVCKGEAIQLHYKEK